MAEVTENRMGPGARLRAAREAKAWDKAETAARLHLSVGVLDDLEGDGLKASVGLPFMRGYLRNYAKLLGLSPDELVKAFDGLHRVRSEEQHVRPIVKSRHEPLDASSSLGYLVGGGLLVLVGGLYLWWQGGQVPAAASRPAPAPAGADAATQEPVSEPAAASPQPDAETVAVTTGTEPSTPAPTVAQPSVSEPAPTEQEAPVATAAESGAAVPEAPAAASTPLAAKPAAELGSAQLALNFSGDCWVKIEDGKGTVLSRGLKRAGHAVNLAGAPPFKLILGNPGAVTLTYQGESVDLTRYPAHQVAKLQLGANG